MSTTQLTIQQKAQKWAFAAKIAAFIVLGLVVAPIIGIAIKGLVGLIVAAVVAFTTLALLPVVGTVVANLRLKLLKAEANQNPVETLQNEYLRQRKLWDQNSAAVQEFNTKVLTFSSKLDGFKKQYPSESAKFDLTLSKMQQLLQLRQSKLLEASHSLVEFQKEIKKADAIWQMGLAAAEASKGSVMTDEDFFSQVKVETSLDAVQDKLNSSFAQLDTLMLENNEPANPLIQVASPVHALAN